MLAQSEGKRHCDRIKEAVLGLIERLKDTNILVLSFDHNVYAHNELESVQIQNCKEGKIQTLEDLDELKDIADCWIPKASADLNNKRERTSEYLKEAITP